MALTHPGGRGSVRALFAFSYTWIPAPLSDNIDPPVRCAYPLMLDVSQRPIVIIGGGSVASRKAKGLLDAGATRITIIAPEFCDAVPTSVQRITAPYTADHLTGAGLIFAATDNPDVNAAIVRDAHQRGLLVSRADSTDEDAGDFSTPAILRDENLVVTVSTGGSPTLAAALRDEIESQLDPRWTKMASAMQTLRPRALAVASIERRRDILRDMATPAAMDILDKDGVEALWQWLRQRHPSEKT
jgi:precorrin-2 dehydrogenase/sirohydrochlorin ferrochelatase